MTLRNGLLFVLALAMPVTAEAADRLVPGTYATINAALAAAGSGDVIRIAIGTYTECVVLPDKGTLASPIIIRADTSDANLPAAGVRFNPATHGAFVASIQAGSSCSTIESAVGASDYQIGPGIKITGTAAGSYPAIELGRNTSSQTLEAHQPENITIDRIWIGPNDWTGLKSGMDLNGRNLTIRNSYIDNIGGIGQDAVGIRCFNGTGPLTIYNNFISAAGYGFICGGDQPYMMTFADVNAGATTTTATLSNLVDRSGVSMAISTLRVGQYVSVLTGGGTLRQHPRIVSCGTSTAGAACTSSSITYTALSAAPDTGTASEMQWGAIPSDISIRRNYFWKDPAWMNNILATPVISSTTPSTASGSLSAGTYYYRVQATYVGYGSARVYSNASTQVSAVLSATGRVTVNWGAVTGPSTGMTYRLFRSTTSGTFAGYIDVGNVTSYVDVGNALTGTSTPPSGTGWTMKNAMEIKFANRVQIDSNIFKNSPVGAESGYAIWIKSNNYGTGNYMHTRDVVFEKNIMDSVDGCFSLLGRIDSSGPNFTRPLENLTIRNNICMDSNTNWMMGKATVYAIKTQSPIVNLTIENNTIQHTMRGFLYLTKTTNALSSRMITNFTVRNNIFRKESYAVFSDNCSQNNISECFTESVTGTSPFVGNVMGGGTGTNPAGNIIAPYTEYESATHFSSYQHTGGVPANFALNSGSSWKGTAQGGGDPGANIALITTATTGVTTGALEGTGGSAPPNITTASPLTSVVEDSAMSSQCISASDGTAPLAWSIVAPSALPAGTTINASSGCITGTPTTPGVYTFNVRATDSAATPLNDTQSFQWTITAASPTLTITTTTLDAVQLAQPISKQIVAVGGTLPHTFTASGLPSWLTISPSGLLEGVPTATGTFNITAQVTDAVAATDTQALSQVVNAEIQTCAGGDRRPFFRVAGITVQRADFRGPTPPPTTAPECARKDDGWFDTSTNTKRIATQATPTSPLVWALDLGEVGGGTNAVILEDTSPPVEGDMIIATSNGSWTRRAPDELTLDAAALVSGTIHPDRLPLSSNQGLVVPFHTSESASLTWSVGTSDTEVNGTQSKRQLLDTSRFTQIRLTMWVQGGHAQATAECFFKWSTTLAYTISDWTAIAGGDVAINTQGPKGGAWADIPAAARTENTMWSLFCRSPAGAGTFAMGTTSAQFR